MKLKTKLLFAVPILLLIICAASTNAYAWHGGYGPQPGSCGWNGCGDYGGNDGLGCYAVAAVGDTMQAFKMLFTIMTTAMHTIRSDNAYPAIQMNIGLLSMKDMITNGAPINHKKQYCFSNKPTAHLRRRKE